MKIEILRSAQDDLRAGFAFYEGQDAGLGAYFLDSLSSDIDSLRLFSGVHPIYFEHYHRLLSKRFPFAVYYKVEDNVVRVYAVMDCRQDSQRTAERMKE